MRAIEYNNARMEQNIMRVRVWHWSVWPHLVGLFRAPWFLFDTTCCILSLQRN